MVTFILAVVLLLLALAAISLQKTYSYLPEAELKRQARAGNNDAAQLYKAVAYGANLRLVMWVLIGLFAALGLTLFARIAPVPFGVILVSGVLWLGFAWLPSSRLSNLGVLVSRWFTPVIVKLLSILNPIISPLTSAWYHRFPLFDHSGLYEQDDLLAVVEQQRRQKDNRISPEILDLVERALKFDQRHVRDIVRVREKLRPVSGTETVGPILLDELHATGQTDFPVYEGSKDKVVATLHLPTLDEARQGGRVIDYSNRKVAYLHEADSLADALHALYQTKQRLFVVINSFDEYVGIVALEDFLQALLGEPGKPSFDAFLDRQAVVNKHQPHKTPDPDMEVLPDSPETATET